MKIEKNQHESICYRTIPTFADCDTIAETGIKPVRYKTDAQPAGRMAQVQRGGYRAAL